jgi:hypothetical protein
MHLSTQFMAILSHCVMKGKLHEKSCKLLTFATITSHYEKEKIELFESVYAATMPCILILAKIRSLKSNQEK